jgi:glycosyltransferase involved in cell wall biosynthesis
MSSPQIGIDVTSALTQGGGIGRYTRELVRALVTLESDNRYTLFSARPPDRCPVPDPLPGGAAIEHRPAFLSERWLYRIWYRLRLPLPVQLFSGQLNLFHSPDFVLPPVHGDIPTLLTVHDLSFIHFPDTFPSTLVNYLNQVVPWSIARAWHVLADSVSTKNDLREYYAVPDEKITVLYSGVSSAYRPVESPTVLKSTQQGYGLDDDPYVLSVGTIQPRKNYQMLIRAFALIAREHPHNLAIAGGKGWLEDEMMAEAARQGIADRVRFLGFVADEHLPALYSGASLFVFPSLYEGFGLPVLEAMACGVPAIISNSSSLPEVGGDAALQLPPDSPEAWADGMNMVLNDRKLAADMIAAGFAQAHRFNWEQAAQELLDIYGTLLDKAGSSRHNSKNGET